MLSRRSPRGSVDRNLKDQKVDEANASRSPRGSVDRNKLKSVHIFLCCSRSPRGSVDRNAFGNVLIISMHCVAPHAGAWIETMDLA